jgi:hypothetical protein
VKQNSLLRAARMESIPQLAQGDGIHCSASPGKWNPLLSEGEWNPFHSYPRVLESTTQGRLKSILNPFLIQLRVADP